MWVTTNGSNTMTSAKSSQRNRRLSAILALPLVALAVTWTSPSYAFDFWNWGKPKKCPSGTAWSKEEKKCVAIKKGSLSDEDLARAGRALALEGHYRDAIKVLAMASNDNDPAVLTYLGYSQRKLGNIDLGISLYKKALDIDPDNVDSFEIGMDTGFPLTKNDAIDYLKFLAVEAHKRGLAIGLKNATEIANKVLDQMDFAVTEDCFDQGWCPDSKNFTAKNKPVFAIEYTDNNIDFDAFCKQAKKYQLSPLLKERNLKTWEKRCP